jgi:hypothetical protein
LIITNGPTITTNGFAQGKKYLGTFLDNGPFDSNPAVGSFNFNLASLGLTPGGAVTATANYSQDPPGTHRATTRTSNFSMPIALWPVKIGSVSKSGTALTISWTGGVPPYSLQRKSTITGAWSTVQTGIAAMSTTDTITGTQAYYQVVGN